MFKSDPVESCLDSFEWLDEDLKYGKVQNGQSEKIIEDENHDNIPEVNKSMENANCQNALLTKPVTKFRLSESFLLPINKSPPKPSTFPIKDDQPEVNINIPIPYCENNDIDIHSVLPETPLSKYYLGKKKKSRISELISTLSVADASNGEIDLKLDQKGGATRDMNYSTILNESLDLVGSDNENN